MILRRRALCTIPLAFALLCAAPAGSQDAEYLADLPDLVLRPNPAKAVCEADGTVTVMIDVTVANDGVTGADLSELPRHVIVTATGWEPYGQPDLRASKPLVLPEATGPDVLGPGEEWAVGTLTTSGLPRFTNGGGKSNRYTIKLLADPSRSVAERNEYNNNVIVFARDPCDAS